MRRKAKRREAEDSHLAGEAGQMMLLNVAEHPLEAEARQIKRCTGQLLWERDRRAYDELINALAAGKSVRWCMRMYGLGTHTVLAIARRERLEVATRKAALADAMLLGAEAYAERALELVDGCEDAYQAAGTAKMLAETSNLMRGQATSITAGIVVNVDANALAEQLAERRRKMDLERGENRALGGGGPAAAARTLPLDVESAVCGSQPVDLQGHCPSSDTLGDTQGATAEAGLMGGGVKRRV